jgi:ligand-binding sensor protein
MAKNSSKHIFHLGDVVDVKILQEIIDCFCNATGLAAIIVDYQGKPITSYGNFHPFCQKLRAHPIGCAGCEKSDAYAGIEAVRTGQPYMYRCHMGLIDLSSPIIVEGQYLGAVMTGQVHVEDDSLERITKPAINLKDYPELDQLHQEVQTV